VALILFFSEGNPAQSRKKKGWPIGRGKERREKKPVAKDHSKKPKAWECLRKKKQLGPNVPSKKEGRSHNLK